MQPGFQTRRFLAAWLLLPEKIIPDKIAQFPNFADTLLKFSAGSPKIARTGGGEKEGPKSRKRAHNLGLSFD
jgi:hypothetical protein